MFNTYYCSNCNNSGFKYNHIWINWFHDNKNKINSFSLPPSENKQPFVFYCDKCNPGGKRYKNYSENSFTKAILSLADLISDWFISCKRNNSDTCEDGVVLSERKDMDVPVSIKTTSYQVLDPHIPKVSITTGERAETTIKKSKKDKEETKSTVIQYGNGTKVHHYSSSINYVNIHYFAGRTYKVEKEDKIYYLFDENGRILHTFDKSPSEDKIREIHNFLVSYQSKFSNEQKIGTLQNLLSALEKNRPALRDALLELEYSGINEKEVFIDMRLLIKNTKTAISTIKKELKKLLPPKDGEKKEEEKKTETTTVVKKKKKKTTATEKPVEIKTQVEEQNTEENPLNSLIINEQQSENIDIKENIDKNINDENKAIDIFEIIRSDPTDFNCNCFHLRRNVRTKKIYHTSNFCKKNENAQFKSN